MKFTSAFTFAVLITGALAARAPKPQKPATKPATPANPTQAKPTAPANPTQPKPAAPTKSTPAKPAAQPIFSWKCAGSEQACNNFCFATKCRGKPSVLTYAGRTESEAGKVRSAAGCGRRPCKGALAAQGDSCDEYPFASSNQGGAGAVLRCVPLAHNTVQGRQLSSFYAKNGGIKRFKGKAYKVVISGGSNINFCKSNAACANDGLQFGLNKPGRTGKIVVFKRNSPLNMRGYTEEDNFTVFDDEEDTEEYPQVERRVYVTEDGEEHVAFLGPDEAPAEVGEVISYGENESKIVLVK